MIKRRLLALLLALALMLTVFSVTAFADDEAEVDGAEAPASDSDEPRSVAKAGPQTAGNGEVLFIPVGGELYVCFDLEPYNGLIPGWRSDMLENEGFVVDPDPVMDDDGYAYAHIKAGDLAVGDSGILAYNWYKPEDIFGENAPGWQNAEPVYSTSVVIQVAELPQTFAFMDGDSVQYFDGDTLFIPAGGEILLSWDLTYYDDWFLPDTDLSDAVAKGFTVDDEIISYEDTGFKFRRIRADGMEPGTTAEISTKWYDFDDYFSGDLSDKDSFYPAAITLQVDTPEIRHLLGDSDGDGEVSVLDATAIQRVLAGLPVEALMMLYADTDRDGTVTILDATVIQRHLAGIETGAHAEVGEDVSFGTYFAAWNIAQELLPADSTLTGADAERAREEIRRALSLLVDRNYITDEIVVEDFDGNPIKRLPADTFIPKWISDDDGTEFHANAGRGDGQGYYSIDDHAENVAEAVAILKKYYAYDDASGTFTNVPELTYIHNESEVHASIADKIREDFAAVGITLKVEAKPWDSYFDVIGAGDFSLARHGWVVDDDNPAAFLDSWKSNSEDNDVGFGKGAYAEAKVYSIDLNPYGIDYKIESGTWSETYDILYQKIEDCGDPAVAYQLMHLAEDMLMSTGCLMPLYYY